MCPRMWSHEPRAMTAWAVGQGRALLPPQPPPRDSCCSPAPFPFLLSEVSAGMLPPLNTGKCALGMGGWELSPPARAGLKESGRPLSLFRRLCLSWVGVGGTLAADV